MSFSTELPAVTLQPSLLVQHHLVDLLSHHPLQKSFKQFLGAFTKLQRATVSFVMFFVTAWNNSPPTGRILMKFGI
jgi:hypothetical protein